MDNDPLEEVCKRLVDYATFAPAIRDDLHYLVKWVGRSDTAYENMKASYDGAMIIAKTFEGRLQKAEQLAANHLTLLKKYDEVGDSLEASEAKSRQRKIMMQQTMEDTGWCPSCKAHCMDFLEHEAGCSWVETMED